MTGKEFYFFNAHYDHEVELARVESSKIVIDRIKSITNNKPFFLTGDFNCMPSSNPIQLLLESGLLVDTRTVDTAVIEGPEGTFHGYNLQRIPTDRIDYVFVSNGMDVKNNIHIDRDRITGQISSDHLPVLSTVSF